MGQQPEFTGGNASGYSQKGARESESWNEMASRSRRGLVQTGKSRGGSSTHHQDKPHLPRPALRPPSTDLLALCGDSGPGASQR